MTVACSMPAYRLSFSQKQPRTNGSSVRLRESPEYVCSGSHHLPMSESIAQTTGAGFGTSATSRRLKPEGPALTISARACAAHASADAMMTMKPRRIAWFSPPILARMVADSPQMGTRGGYSALTTTPRGHRNGASERDQDAGGKPLQR